MMRRFVLCVCLLLLVPRLALAQWSDPFQPAQKVDPPSYDEFWQEALTKPEADLLPWVVSPIYYAEPVGVATTCVSDGMYKECIGNTCIMKKCPMNFPACLGGMCGKPEDIYCMDLDKSEVFTVLSNTPGKPGAYLKLAKSDPSLAKASVAMEMLVTNPVGKQSAQDKCKSADFLEEQVCHYGRLAMVSVSCAEVAPGFVCLTDQNGAARCGSPTAPIPEPEPADVCPDIEGVQTQFVYDLDGDGAPDSCDPPLVLPDVCPEVEGFQPEYLFDLDGDGTNESCVPVDENFCQEPDPKKTYPSGTLYSYDSKWHMGFCVSPGEDDILHVICGDDGKWYTDVTECEMGMPCEQGACAQCYDSDGKYAFASKGYALQIKTDGTFAAKNDYCINATTVDAIVDYICVNDNIYYFTEACGADEVCLEEMANGEAGLACQPAPYAQVCTDADGPDFFTKSYVTGQDKMGNVYTKNDFCQHTVTYDAIVEFVCVENQPQTNVLECASNEVCEEKVVVIDGAPVPTTACVPATDPMTCEDSDGTNNFFAKGHTSGTGKQGGPYTFNDYCLNSSGTHAIVDQICAGSVPSVAFQYCAENELCKETITTDDSGAPTSYFTCVPSCVDTDPGNNPKTPGTVFDFNNEPYPDVCEGTLLYQYKCNTQTGTKQEAGITNCPNGCAGGACL